MNQVRNRPGRALVPIGRRLLPGAGFVLALVATGLAVFSTEVTWLRLAVMLAVWAALAAAFALAGSRRDVRAAKLQTEESKVTYQLELHREVSARREFEVDIIEAARTEYESRHRDELAGLRDQLDRLNDTLSDLLNGGLLVERLTLSAESTTIRQVGAGERNPSADSIRPGHSQQILPAGQWAASSFPAVSTPQPGPPPAPQSGLIFAPRVPAPRAESAAIAVDPTLDDPMPENDLVPEHDRGHFAGVPVADLLAAYGAVPGPPRSRRRAAD